MVGARQVEDTFVFETHIGLREARSGEEEEHKIEGRGSSSEGRARTMSSTAASASAAAYKRYVPPKPAPLPEDYEEFYASLTDAERELDRLAKQWLGSSYFVQWSHMYLKWSKAKANKGT